MTFKTIKELKAELPEIIKRHGRYEEHSMQLEIIETLEKVVKVIDEKYSELGETSTTMRFAEELKKRIEG